MVSFDAGNLVPYEAPALDISDHDSVDWDAWLTPEALCDETNPSQLLLQHIPRLRYEWPKVFLLSDENLQAVHSPDSKTESMRTNSQKPSPGVHASMKCKNTGDPPLLNRPNKQLKSPDHSGAFGSTDYRQKTFHTSPDFESLKVQDIEREASHDAKSIKNWGHAAQYIDCIQKICQIVTGETLSQKQARDVEACCGGLVTDLRTKGSIAASKNLSVNFQPHALPNLDSYDSKSSLTACVAYLRYLNSVASSNLEPGDVHRRLAQIWIHIHFENHVNDLDRSETNGLPLNRRGRAISTIARDSILQATYGSQFIPQKADRDFLSDQCRWGERWWKVASCIGLGVVLLASEASANSLYAHSIIQAPPYYGMIDLLTLNRGRRTAFQNKMVATLAVYVLNRYPALVGLYRSFEPMVVGLMLGYDSAFSRDQLNTFVEAFVEDEAFLSYEQEKWLIPNLQSLSRLAATHLIFMQRGQAIVSPSNS